MKQINRPPAKNWDFYRVLLTSMSILNTNQNNKKIFPTSSCAILRQNSLRQNSDRRSLFILLIGLGMNPVLALNLSSLKGV
jgi:hypothetical protein